MWNSMIKHNGYKGIWKLSKYSLWLIKVLNAKITMEQGFKRIWKWFGWLTHKLHHKPCTLHNGIHSASKFQCWQIRWEENITSKQVGNAPSHDTIVGWKGKTSWREALDCSCIQGAKIVSNINGFKIIVNMLIQWARCGYLARSMVFIVMMWQHI